MGSTPILPVRWPITIGTIIKLYGDRDEIRDGLGMCKQICSGNIFWQTVLQLKWFLRTNTTDSQMPAPPKPVAGEVCGFCKEVADYGGTALCLCLADITKVAPI